jgi:glucosamine--fructose-6-phosphate aminotransferase (isomerizing)
VEAEAEHSVAATKSVIGSMAAGCGLIAELAKDDALSLALGRLPDRLDRALALDWSQIAGAFAKSSAVFIAARGPALGSAREMALKVAEILRLPATGISAAELQHGPRASLSARTPIVMMRIRDETAASVDAVAGELREQGLPLLVCGGPHGSLPWLGEEDGATDPITMLVPAYRAIEHAARHWGFDPDRPPHLSKITETF